MRYKTSINKVAPRKSFPLWVGAFLEPFVPNTWTYLFKVYFHHTGCPKKWTMPWHRLKMEIYDFNHYCCSPKKKSLWGWDFWCPLVPNTQIYLFKVNFYHRGCPKKWTDLSHIHQLYYTHIPTIWNTLWIRICMYLDKMLTKCSTS